jgi:hypothetical protein
MLKYVDLDFVMYVIVIKNIQKMLLRLMAPLNRL